MNRVVIVLDMDSLLARERTLLTAAAAFMAVATEPGMESWCVTKDRHSSEPPMSLLTIEMLQRLSDHVSNSRE